MPRALDPNNTFPIWLDSDEGKEPRPLFKARYLTGREWERLQSLDGGGNPFKPIYDGLRLGIVGWSFITDRMGADVPFDPQKLEDILDPMEAQELLGKLVKGGSLHGDLPKGSAQPSLSASDKSAASAPPASA